MDVGCFTAAAIPLEDEPALSGYADRMTGHGHHCPTWSIQGIYQRFGNELGRVGGSGRVGLVPLAGIAATVFVVVALAGAAIAFTWPPAKIAFRVLGSWMTATGPPTARLVSSIVQGGEKYVGDNNRTTARDRLGTAAVASSRIARMRFPSKTRSAWNCATLCHEAEGAEGNGCY
jgi:hypothetical protein